MTTTLRKILMFLMTTALAFGFMHHLVPGASLYNFERLHIFLFNLCSGGTILLHYSQAGRKVTTTTTAFLLLSLAFALCAFFNLHLVSVILALALAALVEAVRIRRFSLLPAGIFRAAEPVSKKFHQAALLCLSSGLVISAGVMVNNTWLHLVSFPKLKLDTFFLGFSFPLSLITMAVMFSFMKGDFSPRLRWLKNIDFWIVNLGVIIFFVFILYEKLVAQVVVTWILFAAVVLMYFLYQRLGRVLQQKRFLTSGMFFLWYTAITGIIYIVLHFIPDFSAQHSKWLLRMHSFAALYGWNLSGLAVICRSNDFPIRLNDRLIIALHWLTAIVLAPLGTYWTPAAPAALAGYMIVLYMMLFSRAGGSGVAQEE